MRQKSSRVDRNGPCVTMNSRGELWPLILDERNYNLVEIPSIFCSKQNFHLPAHNLHLYSRSLRHRRPVAIWIVNDRMVKYWWNDSLVDYMANRQMYTVDHDPRVWAPQILRWNYTRQPKLISYTSLNSYGIKREDVPTHRKSESADINRKWSLKLLMYTFRLISTSLSGNDILSLARDSFVVRRPP